MRSPEGHEEETKTEETKVEEPVSLVNEPKVEETKVEETKVEEPKTEETKTEVVEPLTPEALTFPEGFTLEPEITGKFLEILNGEMEPKDRANALIALHGETINAALEADSKAWETLQETWRAEVKADPDIGGAKLQPTLANIGKLLDEFGNPELKGVFNTTGAGNNPHMIKFLNVIADKLTEGKFFKASGPAGADEPDAAAKRLFPTMKG